eukprot:2844325-Prymnesium_polylepis.2
MSNRVTRSLPPAARDICTRAVHCSGSTVAHGESVALWRGVASPHDDRAVATHILRRHAVAHTGDRLGAHAEHRQRHLSDRSECQPGLKRCTSCCEGDHSHVRVALLRAARTLPSNRCEGRWANSGSALEKASRSPRPWRSGRAARAAVSAVAHQQLQVDGDAHAAAVLWVLTDAECGRTQREGARAGVVDAVRRVEEE